MIRKQRVSVKSSPSKIYLSFHTAILVSCLSVLFLVVFAIVCNKTNLFNEKKTPIGSGMHSDSFFDEANSFYLSGDFYSAISNYKKAVEQNSKHAAAWANLGNSYREVGLLENAITSHRQALRLTPGRSRSFYNLGVSLQTHNNLIDAIEMYDMTLSIDPTHINAIYNKALAYHDLNELSKAITSYHQVLSIHPDHTDAMLNLCNIQLIEDTSDKSFENIKLCYEQILNKDPTYVRGIVNLAGLYHTYSLFQDAVRIYKRALEIDSSNVMAKHALTSLASYIDNDNVDSETNIEMMTLSSAGESSLGSQHQELPSGPAKPDVDYIRELFDSYSAHFEASLSRLQYHSPAAIVHTLKSLLSSENSLYHSVSAGNNTWTEMHSSTGDQTPGSSLRVLDLGCGTGLVCPLLRETLSERLIESKDDNDGLLTDKGESVSSIPETLSGKVIESLSLHVTGVDLSVKMISKAALKHCYDSLEVQELEEYVAIQEKENQTFDVVIAADVFVYFGDLESMLTGCRKVLSDRVSTIVFTVESLDYHFHVMNSKQTSNLPERNNRSVLGSSSVQYRLLPTGRFAHSKSYLLDVSRKSGLEVVDITESVLRLDKAEPIHGYLVVVRKSV